MLGFIGKVVETAFDAVFETEPWTDEKISNEEKKEALKRYEQSSYEQRKSAREAYADRARKYR